MFLIYWYRGKTSSWNHCLRKPFETLGLLSLNNPNARILVHVVGPLGPIWVGLKITWSNWDIGIKLTTPSQQSLLQLSSYQSGPKEFAGEGQNIPPCLTWPAQSSMHLDSYHSSVNSSIFDRTWKVFTALKIWQYWLHSGEGKRLVVKPRKQHTPTPHWGACG